MNAPEKFENIRVSPDPWKVVCADSVAIVQMLLEKQGDVIPQHSHTYDHHTLIARGSVRVWADGADLGTYNECEAVFIEARKKHLFVALEDNTVAYCIHNTHGMDDVDIHAEHHLE